VAVFVIERENVNDVFKNNERMNKKKYQSKEIREAYYVFRELLWKAIDENDEDFSIVETAKALGLYK